MLSLKRFYRILGRERGRGVVLFWELEEVFFWGRKGVSIFWGGKVYGMGWDGRVGKDRIMRGFAGYSEEFGFDFESRVG